MNRQKSTCFCLVDIYEYMQNVVRMSKSILNLFSRVCRLEALFTNNAFTADPRQDRCPICLNMLVDETPEKLAEISCCHRVFETKRPTA
jgi:hypothetical protein